jgi:membrane peptidoglycan carboxypeptidase
MNGVEIHPYRTNDKKSENQWIGFHRSQYRQRGYSIILCMSEELRISQNMRRRRRHSLARLAKSRLLGGGLLLAAAMVLAAAAAFLLAPLPFPAPSLALGSRPDPARFYDRSGRLLTEAGSQHAEQSVWYSLVDTPESDCILTAFLAARGIPSADWRPEGSVNPLQALADALLGRDDLAGETTAELLAINGVDRSVWSRARLSAALAARYNRRQMAEWLINVRLYGNGAVGADDAALTYFQSHAAGLPAAGCAALEALAGDPSRAQSSPEWKNARDEILNRMLNYGYTDKEKWLEASNSTPSSTLGETAGSVFGGRLPFLDSFLALAVSRLGDDYPPDELPRSGLRVFTSLDLDFEMQALCAAQNLITPGNGSAASIPTLEGKPCDLAALLGPGAGLDVPQDLSLAVIDPESGELLAYFSTARGGESVARGPAGTSLLPFVFLSAFTRGFAPASMLLDIPRTGSIANLDGKYLGPISARSALQERRLAATEKMAAAVGGDQIARTFSLLGLSPDGNTGFTLSDSLGQSAELLPLTKAYSLIAGSGTEVEDPSGVNPPVILRVENQRGDVIGNYAQRQTRRIVGSDLAYLIQDILSDESGRADVSSPALAGSRSRIGAMLAEDPTGRGSWAFALTPKFVIGVRGTGTFSQPQTPWALAQAAAGWILRSIPEQQWPQPPGIVREDVCLPSGLLPGRYCPDTASEIFLAGTEPSQIDTFYQPVAVNRETGRLATIWTPVGLVDERVFFILTGDARSWAEQSGFPLPPEVYDTLPDSFPYFDDLHLSNPNALDILHGKVTLRGTATVSGMSRYVLQAGPGLYPEEWFTLGSGAGPVSEGDLAEWDTSGLEGVWSIQLMAVYPNGKILTVALPVTLDNTPPVIRWIQPDALKQLSITSGEALILQVDVSDNMAVEAVEFFLDGAIRTRLENGPFSVRWDGLAPGKHLVKVCATDLAGNESCTVNMEVDVGLKTSGILTYNTPGKAVI